SPPGNFMTALFTLQFLTLAERRLLLARINEALIEGGGLIIVEKVCAEYSSFEGIWNELHWDFKRRQGLTPEQILEKANSIRGVLNPLTINENLEILTQTGFDRVEVFFKWYNWAGFVAVKNNALVRRQPSAPVQAPEPRGQTRKKNTKRSRNG
ncbi:MAG TPA: hypothetical protein VLB09_06850, partial [Nitrospiria bacterium]|nr:hypothetical protein [Nitrospiria bacterium]